MEEKPKVCGNCKALAVWFNYYCGAYVCEKCFNHTGLGMCFCGWKKGGYPLSLEDRAEMESGA